MHIIAMSITPSWQAQRYRRGSKKMYVTRPLSRYLDNPDAAAERPPEGPGSGFLVVEDEAAVERATVCCGLLMKA
jgi:hypothetical protein